MPTVAEDEEERGWFGSVTALRRRPSNPSRNGSRSYKTVGELAIEMGFAPPTRVVNGRRPRHLTHQGEIPSPMPRVRGAPHVTPYQPGSDDFRILVDLSKQPEPNFSQKPSTIEERIRQRYFWRGYAIGWSPDLVFHIVTGIVHILPSMLGYAVGMAFRNSKMCDRAVIRARLKLQERNETRRKQGKRVRQLSTKLPQWMVMARNFSAYSRVRMSPDLGRFASGFGSSWAFTQAMTSATQFVRHLFGAAKESAPLLEAAYLAFTAMGALRAGLPRVLDKYPVIHEWIEAAEDWVRERAAVVGEFRDADKWFEDVDGKWKSIKELKNSPVMEGAITVEGIPEPDGETPEFHLSVKESLRMVEKAVGFRPKFWSKSYAPFMGVALALKRTHRIDREGDNAISPLGELAVEHRLAMKLLALQDTIRFENFTSYALDLSGFSENVQSAFVTLQDQQFKEACTAEMKRSETVIRMKKRNAGYSRPTRIAATVATFCVIATSGSGVAAATMMQDIESGVGTSQQSHKTDHADATLVTPQEQARIDARMRAAAEQMLEEKRAQERIAEKEQNLKKIAGAEAVIADRTTLDKNTDSAEVTKRQQPLALGVVAAAAEGDHEEALRLAGYLRWTQQATGDGPETIRDLRDAALDLYQGRATAEAVIETGLEIALTR